VSPQFAKGKVRRGYRKRFELPATAKGQRVQLLFDMKGD
jgi:hypothetical protein